MCVWGWGVGAGAGWDAEVFIWSHSLSVLLLAFFFTQVIYFIHSVIKYEIMIVNV